MVNLRQIVKLKDLVDSASTYVCCLGGAVVDSFIQVLPQFSQ